MKKWLALALLLAAPAFGQTQRVFTTKSGNNVFTGNNSFTRPLIVAEPTDSSHAATKLYVDTHLTGGSSNPEPITAESIAAALTYTPANSLDLSNHLADYTNPHQVTALQVGAIPTTSLSTLTSLGTSDTLVPSQNAVKSYVDAGLATKAASNASVTVNSQVCTLGGSCSIATGSGVPDTAVTDGQFLTGFASGAFTKAQGDYTKLLNKPTIPTALSGLTDDTTHRLVTDTEKSTWNGKAEANASTTVNGTTCALGSTCTVTSSVTYPLTATDGTAAAPSYAFANATNWGFYKAATGIGVTTAGAGRWVFTSGGDILPASNFAGNIGSASYYVGDNYSNNYYAYTNIVFRSSSSVLKFYNGSANDRGLSRDSNGYICAGNGTGGDCSGTYKAAAVLVGSDNLYANKQLTFIQGCDTCSALADTDDQSDVWVNRLGRSVTITEVYCESDAGTPSMNLLNEAATVTTITCSTTGATGTLANATVTNGSHLHYQTATAGGTAKRVTVSVVYK